VEGGELLLKAMLAWNSPRVPVAPSWLKVSWVEEICEPVVVKLAGLPIVLPPTSVNVIVPLHDAAGAVAVLTIFTWAVSELAKPSGGKL